MCMLPIVCVHINLLSLFIHCVHTHNIVSPWLLCVATVRALRGLALLNTVNNYSTVVDQSDYSINTILYNNIILSNLYGRIS